MAVTQAVSISLQAAIGRGEVASGRYKNASRTSEWAGSWHEEAIAGERAPGVRSQAGMLDQCARGRFATAT